MKLANPPYIQVALDLVDFDIFTSLLSQLVETDKLLIEAGTPLIKKFGVDVVSQIRKENPLAYIIADMKTLDVGWLEVQIGAEAGADAVAISGLAPLETIESSLDKGQKTGTDIILDLMNVEKPVELLAKLSRTPEIVLFHRGIDQEGNKEHPWDLITQVKTDYPNSLVAVAGGLNLESSKKALANSADIIIIGRAITQAKDVKEAVKEFLSIL